MIEQVLAKEALTSGLRVQRLRLAAFAGRGVAANVEEWTKMEAEEGQTFQKSLC